jgi:hypothetical protein
LFGVSDWDRLCSSWRGARSARGARPFAPKIPKASRERSCHDHTASPSIPINLRIAHSHQIPAKELKHPIRHSRDYWQDLKQPGEPSRFLRRYIK